jgi:hypothetical protein
MFPAQRGAEAIERSSVHFCTGRKKQAADFDGLKSTEEEFAERQEWERPAISAMS